MEKLKIGLGQTFVVCPAIDKSASIEFLIGKIYSYKCKYCKSCNICQSYKDK